MEPFIGPLNIAPYRIREVDNKTFRLINKRQFDAFTDRQDSLAALKVIDKTLQESLTPPMIRIGALTSYV